MFQDLTDIYEAMIDWPKRLAREGPFYRRLFERHAVRSVVDAACGTGRHAAMFHSWGLRVEGADVSPAMIDRARASFGQPVGLRWAVRGFEQPIAPPEPLDAVICVGNSLPLAPDMATVGLAIGQMLSALRRGGVLVVHALNLWRLPEGPCIWQKCRPASLPQGEVLIIKGVHRCGVRGYVELIVVPRTSWGGSSTATPTASSTAAPTVAAARSAEYPATEDSMQTDCVPFWGLEAAELESITLADGTGQVQLFGGYQDEPYIREQSADLLLVAEKA